MVLEIEPFLLVVGLMIVGAFIGTLVFKRFRFPDIILLISIGVLLGPVYEVVQIDVFRAIAPLVSTIAIILILFEGGLKVSFDDILHGVAGGSLLAVLVFTSTALLGALVAYFLTGAEPLHAILLGMALGGAGAVIVIPLIQQMGVSERARTIVSIEAATSDVLVVVGVVGLATALQLEQTEPGAFVARIVQTFAVGLALGIAAGYGWAWVLRRFTERSYEYVLTIAALFLIFAITEFIHGSGALAVVAMGLIVGNSTKTQRVSHHPDVPKNKRGRTWRYAPVFGVDLQNLHHELVFFVRAFFFVALGVLLNLDILVDPQFLLIGFLLTVCVIAGRFWGVVLVFGRSRMPTWDKISITLMFPLGLAAAALSIVPWERFGIRGTENFGSYAAVVIVMTNVVASLLVWIFSSDRFRTRFEAPAVEEPDEEEVSSRRRPWLVD